MLDFTQVTFAICRDRNRSTAFIRLAAMALMLIASVSMSYGQLSVSFTLQEPTCFGLPNGSITANVSGGTAPYTFLWNTGATTQTLSGVFAGSYSVTVVDNNGMAEVESVTLNQPTLVTATLDANDCTLPFSITVFPGGGVPPYTYFWSTGATTQTISNLAPGNYCVTVTDDHLCGVVECIELENNPISVSVGTNNLTCPNSNDGSVTAFPFGGTPPYSYLWNTGATTQSITNLGPGSYTVTLTDSNGCSVSATGFVTAPPPIVLNTNANNPTCIGDTNGSVSVSVSGGTPPYSYLWNTGNTGPFIGNLGPGTYTVTVTDANNCPASTSVVLTPQSNLTAGAFGTMETCPDADDGFLTATANGGVMPFTYLWSNGATTQVVTNVTPGDYSVTITDALGCTATASTMVMAAPNFIIDVDGNNISTCGATNGTVFVTILAGGTAPFDYSWNTGDETAVVTNLPAGTYSVTVTDANNCEATGSVTIIAPPDVNISINATPIVCPDANTGSAMAIPLSGTPPYSYLWNTGATTQTINNLGAGVYSVTVADANGCMDSQSVVIMESPDFSINVVGTTIVCGAGNTGSATALIIDGSGTYTYLWSTGATTPMITGLGEGTYSVTVTDVSGCTETDDITIDIVDDLDVTVEKTNLDCFGDASGTATATGSGGTPPYTFLWNTGATSAMIGNLPAGTYTVTLTDQNGCTDVATVAVGQPPLLTVSINASELVCEGESTGTAMAVPNGGTAPYTYEWSTGATTQTIMGLGAGTYSVTVTDANECEAVAMVTIDESPGLEVTINATEILCGVGETGMADVQIVGGTGPFTYMWSTGATTESVENLPAGTYSVTVEDANGCTGTDEVTIEMVDDLMVNIIIRNVLCTGDENGGALAEVTGGLAPYTYMWNTGETVDELVDLPAGNYSVTVTDANGCTAEASATVAEPAALMVNTSVDDVDCFGESTGAASATPVGGTPPYTIEWSTGQMGEMISGLAAGTYTVTVTDDNLCTVEASVTIDEPGALDVTVNAPIIVCGGTATGSATAIVAGGTPPYTYSWSNGGMTDFIDNLPAGIYEITVTDANGCTVEGQTFTVAELPELTLDFEVTDIICTDENIGEISVTVNGGTGPYTYAWSNGDNTPTISNLAAGTYSLTVTDVNDCMVTGMATVTQTNGLMVNASSTDVTCFGFDDGTAMVVATGGIEPYTYEWSNGMMTASIMGLAPGTYSVTVTDNVGCMGETMVTIAEPDMLSVSLMGTDVTCAGDNDGSITATVMGGTPPYTYIWSNGMMGAMISGIGGGSYTLTVRDDNGCEAMASITINEPDDLQVLAVQLGGTCEGEMDGSVQATASGGTPPYTYEWNSGQETALIAGLGAGTYTVTVTDANECTETASVTITAFDAPSCTVNILSESLMGDDGSLEVVVSGGTGPFNYMWSNGMSTAIISGLAPGTYSVTVTDANGCETVCENTLDALSGIGDYVWEDIDHDGLQDMNEPPVEGVTVNLKDESGTVIATTTTDANGFYIFLGLTPGTYSVQFVLPDGFDFTLANGGDDALDSDAIEAMNGMTVSTVLDPGEIDLTWDAGIYVPPYNDIDDPCNCLNNATTENNGQFGELLTIFSYPNETWTIIEVENVYDISSPEPPAMPIPLSVPVVLTENVAGEYQLNFKLVDEEMYTIYATNGFDTLTISNLCEYPTIGVAELPSGNICFFDNPIDLVATPSIPGEVTFYLEGTPVTMFDPEIIGVGTYQFVVEFVPFDPDECIARIVTEIVVFDDCQAKVGDFVWNDLDQDGIQDPGEPGIEDVKVIISGVEEDDDLYADTTYTDATGMYMFMVPPGTYKVTFCGPDNFIATTPNQGGDDALDSDADPVMGMTDVFTVEDGDMNFTIDAGFYNKCDNVTNPGSIGFYQFLCGPGVDPDPLVEVTPPSGGSNALEYLWMYSTEPGPFDINIWTPIPNSNSPTYDPGPIYETTYFARCVRRECCTTYLESNIITIEVGSVAVADINGPSVFCEDTPTNFFAAGVGPDAVVEWNFGAGANPQIATGTPVSVTYSSFGTFQIFMSVTEDGCTSTDTKTVVVTNNPTVCGSNLVLDVNVINQEYIVIDWTIDMQPEQLRFVVEHSADGVEFNPIGEVNAPMLVGDGKELYEFTHDTPKIGRNLYRVLIEDPDGNTAYSEIGEGIIYGDSKVVLVYPNPVDDELRIELFETFKDEVTIEVIGIQGIIHETLKLAPDTEYIDLDFENYPAGAYFLRLRFGDVDVKTLKVVKQ